MKVKKFLGLFLILGFVQSFVGAIPKNVTIFIGGNNENSVYWGGGFSEYDFSDCPSVEAFAPAFWDQVQEKIDGFASSGEKIFSDDEKIYLKKAADYFSEFCNTPHEGDGWYGENQYLEGVPLELKTSYVAPDGWHSVKLKKAGLTPDDASNTWHATFTAF
jgi:hypothetical protein